MTAPDVAEVKVGVDVTLLNVPSLIVLSANAALANGADTSTDTRAVLSLILMVLPSKEAQIYAP
jgi:hypothetical protein